MSGINPDAEGLAPVIEDLSAYVIAGAVSAVQTNSEYETVSRTPAQGIDDGVEAERLGLRRVWLSERFNIKTSDVILSGIAARTSRLEVGAGVINPCTRHPMLTASMATTMQCCYGPRFNLGLGRSEEGAWTGTGIHQASFGYLGDYADIVRRLQKGESINYDGPVGKFENMSLAETYPGQPTPIWLAGFALPKGAAFVAKYADGILLPAQITPDAVHAAVGRIREACERIGRDPKEIRVCALVVTAPDLDDFETRSIAHGRMVTYMTQPHYGETKSDVNGWDRKVLEAVRNHKLFQSIDKVPDWIYHRHQLLDAGALIPDSYMEDCCALGTVDECVKSLQRFIDAGANEIAIYGSTPRQNAKLIEAWRERRK